MIDEAKVLGILKLFSRDSRWRMLAAVGAFLILVGTIALIGFAIYEGYTGTFRLARLQKSIDLLKQLQTLQSNRTNLTSLYVPDNQMETARNALVEQVVEVIQRKPFGVDFVPQTLRFQSDTLWKFVCGSALFWIIGLMMALRDKAPKRTRDLLNNSSFAVIFGLIAILLPPIWWPIFHLFVYPCLVIFAIFSALALYAVWGALRAARKKAQTIRCVSNLKQIILAAKLWGSEHGGVFPKDFASMKEYLVTDKLMCCPADISKRYELVSPGIAENEPSAVYARCPFHNNVALVDGSVQQLGKKKTS